MDTQELMRQISYGQKIAERLYNDGFRLGQKASQLYAILKGYCDKDGIKCTKEMKSAFIGKLGALERQNGW